MILYLRPVEGHTSEHRLRDAGPLQLVSHPLVDLHGDLGVGGHLRLQRLVERPVDGRVVQVLLAQGLLGEQAVDGVLLVEDLSHHDLLVHQLGADGCGHQAGVEAGQLGSAGGLTAVGQGHWRGRLLGRAARDGLLAEAEVVGPGWREIRQTVHFGCGTEVDIEKTCLSMHSH